MAIEIQCVSLVLRRDAIDSRYAGGWVAFLDEHRHLLGLGAWYDEHLFCLSVMDGSVMPAIVRRFGQKGLTMMVRTDGRAVAWADGCILDGRRLTLPCEWVEFARRNAVFLRGHEPGEIITRRHFPVACDLDDPPL